MLYQIGALAAIAASEGVPLSHVKAHGALYNMAARDRSLADAIARAAAAFDPALILFGLPDSELLRAGEAAGLRVASEGFADRAYMADGSLAPRTAAWLGHSRRREVVRRALRMVTRRRGDGDRWVDVDVSLSTRSASTATRPAPPS